MNLENKKQIAIIALAVGLGLVAVVLTGNHIQSTVQTQSKSMAREFKKMDNDRRQQMERIRREMQALAARQQAVAQQAPAVAKPQQPSNTIPKSTLALRTPPGKRALTINIDSLSAVGGLINPGDYIDILGHLTVPEGSSKSKPFTAIIFQNIQVLAVGANLESTGGYAEQQQARALTITFAVDPEEAGLLTFATKHGRLQLLLRAQQETETQMLQEASWDTFSEYVLNKSGVDLSVPRTGAMIQTIGEVPGQATEAKPYIQIFRGGREL